MTNAAVKTISILAIFALLSPGWGGAAAAVAQERPVFRASVALVPITAVVRNSRNQLVRGLLRDEFQVREDGEVREIVDFRSTDTGPVSIAVLFDTSGSMRGPNLDRGIEAVNQLLDTLNQEGDEVALFTFDKTLQQQTPFTEEVDLVRCAMDALEAWGLTSIYDAVADTADEVAARSSANRRVVIVVTDGADTSSTFSPAAASARASEIEMPVYVLDLAPDRRDRTLVPHADEANLANLAFSTGGDVRHVTSIDTLNIAIAGLMSELRQQYFLAIESASTEGWRRLEVTTNRDDVMIRARSGYFAAQD